MLKTLITFILGATLCLCVPTSRDRNNKPYRIVCYWGSWAAWRDGNGASIPENMNPNLCTHMMYGFAILDASNNSIRVFDKDVDLGDEEYTSGLPWGKGMYRRFNRLREFNPHLTTMLSIGGWKEGSDKYSKMASNAQSRKQFVDSVVEFLRWSDFDGLDFDWEYPGFKAISDEDRTPGNVADKQNFILLLRELKAALKPKGYVLSAAVSAGKPTVDRAYDVKQLNELLDFINIMSYDFHGGWENKTAHNAPLYPNPKSSEKDKEFTVEYAIDYWLKLGADPKKMTMAVPLYGRTFTLASPTEHGIGAKAIGTGGQEGNITHLVGTLGYNEICLKLKSNQWTVYRDDIQKIPYAVKGNQWIGYDDVRSIKDKLAFLKSRKLSGAIVWSLETEDFTDQCGPKHTLMKTISGELNHVTGPDVVIPITHVTAYPRQTTIHQVSHPTTVHPDDHGTSTTTTKGPIDGQFKCTASGYYADPKDKTIFHQCVDTGNGKFKDFVVRCPTGTVYDVTAHICRNA